KNTNDDDRQSLLKAIEYDELKTAFLAVMSHEIRTPMNSIIGFTNLLLKDKLSEKQKNYLEIVKKNSSSLLSIINDILDLSKIKAGQIKIEPSSCSLQSIFEQIEANAKMMLSQKNKDLSLRKFFPETVNQTSIICDAKRVSQVINYLLDNAIKFSDKGFIEYGVSLKEKDKVVEFYVRDTGIGIPDEKQTEIFEAFRQADLSLTRRYGGIGIGLTIIKNLLDLMGGEIKFISKIGEEHGSTFFFTLPYELNESTKNVVEEKKKNNDSQSGPTLLVVDDDIANQILLKEILEGTNYNVLVANDGREAVSIYKCEPSLDLIIMDIQMPILDGFEATQVIRFHEKKEEKEKRIPIIAVTAVAVEDNMREKCLKAGCDDYMAIPFDHQKFLKIVKEHLQKNTPAK
ncbi:ATP-binding protein, partial [Candidatus Auribacterota bacterium]